MNSYLRIVSSGIAVPEKVLSNADLEKIVDTSNEWIISRTGISERRISGEGVSSGDLGAQAARMALDNAGVTPDGVDLILVATASGDHLFPSTACIIQNKLGAKNAAAFDISAACSGFLFCLTVAHSLLATGAFRNALIIGAETLSKITDYTDRSTCVLFGDGAGAMLVELGNDGRGLFASHLGSDGSYAGLLNLPAGGSRLPATADTVKRNLHFIKMNGNELYKVAVRSMEEAALLTMQKAGISPEQIDLLIPHQANIRIINSLLKRLDIDEKKVYINIERYGNTSAASIPIAYHEARTLKLFDENSTVLMVAFGGGITWGGVLVRG
ncbi:MAG TPA: beta-ketoacyl-ACP synthase III [Candidatus Glassbacteria bacterium]|nr:beta-ketoacyl-ACP synthase III [Candidatus Glassbacteria bacterium]